LVHAHVIRPYSHSLSDDEVQYRPGSERDADAARDPLRRFPEQLLARNVAAQAELETVKAAVEEELRVATDIALAAPQPSRDTVYDYVYSMDVDPSSEGFDTEDDPRFTGDPTT